MQVQPGVAGGSAQRKYEELLRSWRRRNRRVFVGLALVCGLIVLASLLLARIWPGQSWLLGCFAGGAATFFGVARLSPPGWIENWQLGAWGEEATAKALGPMEAEGWVVVHDLPTGRGNVDHVVVGPGGVFLLDSKRVGGSVVVEGEVMTVRRLDDPELVYRHPGSGHLLGLARETHERVLRSTRIRVWVQPVMVVWAEFPQRKVQGRCAFVHGEELAEWLRAQPQRVAPARVPQLVAAVRLSWDLSDQASTVTHGG
ncbi:nuclease-related domain-containing protein [Dermatophilaceae bacterium Soc4.6]